MSDSPISPQPTGDTLWNQIDEWVKKWREACDDEEGQNLLAFLDGSLPTVPIRYDTLVILMRRLKAAKQFVRMCYDDDYLWATIEGHPGNNAHRLARIALALPEDAP